MGLISDENGSRSPAALEPFPGAAKSGLRDRKHSTASHILASGLKWGNLIRKWLDVHAPTKAVRHPLDASSQPLAAGSLPG